MQKLIFQISPKRQLLFLISFYCFFILIGAFVSVTIQRFTNGQAAKLSLSAVSIFGLFIPAYIIFKLFSKKKLTDYWALNQSYTFTSLFFTVLITICCIVLTNWLEEVNKLFPLFDWMKASELKANLKLNQYIKMDNYPQLLLNLLIFSAIPAFCEEVFFRGTMQPLLYKSFTKPWKAIFFTALIFSFLHFQFSGFLPRLLAGGVMGGIFYFTGSLWLPIISHFLFNGYAITLAYVNQHAKVSAVSFENMLLHPVLIISGAFMIVLLFYLLQKHTARNRNNNNEPDF